MVAATDSGTNIARRPPALIRAYSGRRVLGASIIAVITVLGILAPVLGLYNPNESSMDTLQGASAAHWCGTDELGRDIFSRVIYGVRVSLLIGLGVGVFATVLGVPIGLFAGYVRGKTDLLIVQIIDLFIALPALILALLITAIVGSSAVNIALVLGFVMWPTTARLVRSQVISIRETLFVEAARASGGSALWIMWRHILPNTVRLISAQFSITVGFGIFSAASLSFLGLGVPPPTPDWGTMVREGAQYLSFTPLMSLAPGIAVTLTVLGFYLVGSKND